MKIVMTSAASGGALVDDSGARVTDAGYADRRWVQGWVTSARKLARSGAQLYLIEDSPYQPGNVPECLSAHPDDPRACVVTAGRALPARDRRRAISAALKEQGVTPIDPLPWFCTVQACPVIVGNVLVYRDTSHLTATYSRMLGPLLEPYLR